MNYEEKYKEALKVIESLYNVVKYQSSSDALLTSQTIEKAFPELRESKDEKIRKGLIKGLSAMRDIHKHQTFSDDAINIDDAIAWLERQVEKRYTWSEEDESRICQIIDWLSICKTYNPDQKSVCDISMQIAWLKSIKPNHWKPSEEQLRAIINSAQGLYQCKEKEVLLDLYEQLKNL